MDRVRVLVIDDDEQITGFLRRALAYAGFAVDTAATAAAGLRQAATHWPDVVVLDVMLPDQDGLTTCRQLRAIGTTRIVMLTARATADDRRRGLASGADDYLPKPFALTDLIARIRILAGR